MPIVRPAHRRDLVRLVAIYNHYVEHSIATFDTAPTSVENRTAWFETFSATGPHRLLVATDGGRVLGCASSGSYRAHLAFDQTVEVSVYIDPRSGRRVSARPSTALCSKRSAPRTCIWRWPGSRSPTTPRWPCIESSVSPTWASSMSTRRSMVPTSVPFGCNAAYEKRTASSRRRPHDDDQPDHWRAPDSSRHRKPILPRRATVAGSPAHGRGRVLRVRSTRRRTTRP